MLCKKPFMKGLSPFPCGQCLPCRINRRRLWTSRLMLEAQSHEHSSFWTLTYDEANHPHDSSLNPVHTRNWLKRLRRSLENQGRSVRYYLVGEYGDTTQRPHYHAALFGVSEQETDLVGSVWPYGFVYAGSLTSDSAGYIAGYVTKKMTSKDDPRLEGRFPEFARMSLKPGIGALSVDAFAETLTTIHGCESIIETGDVPISYRSNGRNQPIGRYMRRKLREHLGFENIGGQEKSESLRHQEMLAMQEDSGLSTKMFKEIKPFVKHQKIRQVEGKFKIFSQGKKL